MADNSNRAHICSVLCLDIVEYSQRNVAEQIRLKERFNATLTEAIAGVAKDDRIILDTGGGAELSFLGAIEDAMFAGVGVRDALAVQPTTGGPRLQVRFGINLGPVRLAKDINGRPSAVGDGVNVARSIMNFSDRGQILVSRSYHDVLVRMSESHARLFSYQGAKTDKHVHEYEVYVVGPEASSVFRRQGAKTGSTTTIAAWMRNLFR